MGSMICCDVGEVRFNYRLSAVCSYQGHVLLNRSEDDAFWVLPGGRAETMETSREAIRREMREEVEQDVKVGRLLWVVENFFTHGDRRFHELSLIYEVTLAPASPWLNLGKTFECVDLDLQGRAVKLEFRWFAQDELDDIDLRPSFLRDRLRQLPAAPEHVVHHGP